jgi:protein tyrosine/serine phosphatase
MSRFSVVKRVFSFSGSRGSAILLLCVLLLSCYNCASLPSRAGRSLPGIGNFGALEGGSICRSAQPEGREGFRAFRQWGGKTVVNLRSGWDERQLVSRAGLTPYWFELEAGSPPTVEEIERIVGIIAEPANQPVLVHCRLGQDRTGLIIASYRIIRERWTFDRAYGELKDYAFGGVEVHRGIVRRLKEVAAKYGQ